MSQGGPPRPDPVRLARTMRGVYSALLCLEALVILLVPRTIAQFGPGLTTFRLVVCLTLAALLIGCCVVIAKPWGYVAGSVLQVAVLATGFLVTAMFFLGLIFGLIWFATGRLHRDLLARAKQQ